LLSSEPSFLSGSFSGATLFTSDFLGFKNLLPGFGLIISILEANSSC
jgi:hypothetical protein